MKDRDGHDLDEDGDHDDESCRMCLEGQTVTGQCRCGQCCRLLIEVDLEDAELEPRIKECKPIMAPPELTESGRSELIGYLLNSKRNDYACAFLDRGTNLCTIYETRPLVCRLFDCDGEDRHQLIELGIIQR